MKSNSFVKLFLNSVDGRVADEGEVVLVNADKICKALFYDCSPKESFGIIEVRYGNVNICYNVSNSEANYLCQISADCEPCGTCDSCVVVDANSGCEVVYNGCLVVAPL